MKIRKATIADYDTILSLIREFAIFQKTPGKVLISLEQMIWAKDHFQCFVAELDTLEIAGFASFFFAYYSWSGRALYLDDLYVKEKYRQSGLGKQLLAAVIDHARNHQCLKLRWQVSKWNSDAIEFYKRLGANIDETEINCDLHL